MTDKPAPILDGELSGPDEDGFCWLRWSEPGSSAPGAFWLVNFGRYEHLAPALADWLAHNDYGDKEGGQGATVRFRTELDPDEAWGIIKLTPEPQSGR